MSAGGGAPIHAWTGPGTRYLDHGDNDSLDSSAAGSSQYSASHAEVVEDWSRWKKGQLSVGNIASPHLETPREMKPAKASADDVEDLIRSTLADTKYDPVRGFPAIQIHTGLLDAITRREEPPPQRCPRLRRAYSLILKLVALLLLNGAFVYACVTWGFQLRRHVREGGYKTFVRSFFSKFPDITLGDGLTLSGGENGEMVWRGDLAVRNGIKAGWVTQTSDSRLKTDVNAIGSKQDLLFDLEGVTFRWRDEDRMTASDHYGFIAQQVQSVLPELVHEGSDGKLSVEYTAVVPIMVEAMKTQREEMDDMKATVTALKSELSRLRNDVDAAAKLNEGQKGDPPQKYTQMRQGGLSTTKI